MTNEQILRKAIEKAIKNGFIEDMNEVERVSKELKDYPIITKAAVYLTIFNHDFAKAFWGEEEIMQDERFTMPKWKVELQTMVLEKEPLKYIEKFL